MTFRLMTGEPVPTDPRRPLLVVVVRLLVVVPLMHPVRVMMFRAVAELLMPGVPAAGVMP